MLSLYESTRLIKEHNIPACKNKAAKRLNLNRIEKAENLWLYSHWSG